jgi:antitoxin HicB
MYLIWYSGQRLDNYSEESAGILLPDPLRIWPETQEPSATRGDNAMRKRDDRHTGSSFNSFLAKEGMPEQVEAVALKRMLAWQLQQAMMQHHISKQQMAKQLGTSRSQVDRLLDPSHTGVSIATISKAAHAVGKRVRLEIIDGGKAAMPVRTRAKQSVLPSRNSEPRRKRA